MKKSNQANKQKMIDDDYKDVVKPTTIEPKTKIPFFTKVSLRLLELKWAITDKFVLEQKYRIILAITLTIGIIGGLVYFSGGNKINFNQQQPKKDNTAESDFLNNPTIQNNLAKLENIKDSLKPRDIVYDFLKYEDLPIYPISWVGRTFSDAEQRNSLISGPAADPDNDGLTNKAEYLFGSDPKNKYTLCGKNEGETKCLKTDKENVDAGISPLTGFAIETNRNIVLRKQDTVVIESIQESFESASKEGVDFPILYQESNLIDLKNELDDETFVTTEDNRDSYTFYIDTRLDVLDKFLAQDELESDLGGLLIIYKATQLKDLEILKTRYTGLLQVLKTTAVPNTYTKSHQAFILLFKKLIKLIETREIGIQNKTQETPEFQALSKKIAVEIVWSYRQMNEELLRLSSQ